MNHEESFTFVLDKLIFWANIYFINTKTGHRCAHASDVFGKGRAT